jgi:hypothetical protein
MIPRSLPVLGRYATGLIAGLLFLIVGSIWAPESAAYEHRRGIPSVGGQLQRGYLWYDSEWTETFEWGRGGTIRVRQYVARNRAIGFSFEQQKFYRIKGLPKADPTFNADALQLHILMFDYYFYFNRLRKWTHYLVLSAGGYRPEMIDEHEGQGLQVDYPSESYLLRCGYGLERFLSRTVSIDLSFSLYYIEVPRDHGLTVSGQLALGLHVYTGK